ncbi:ABC transporter permease [Mesorhizobium sp. PL10]
MSVSIEARSRSRLHAGVARIFFTIAVFFVPIFLVAIPFASFLYLSLGEVHGPNIVMTITSKNFVRIATDPLYLDVIWTTLLLCASIAMVCVIFGYPIAYLLAILSGGKRYALMCLVVIPLLLNYVIKIYAMRSILGQRGLLNQLIMALGLSDTPTRLFVFNLNAVFLVLVSILLPFAVLPIYIALERIPNSLLSAAYDLGASRVQTFLLVVFPLSMSGVAVGFAFTFVFSIGDFVTPQMVGGPSGFTLGRVVYSQFGLAFNWPFGSALAIVLMAIVVAALAVPTLFSPKGTKR